MIDLDRLNNRMDAEKWAHPEMVEAYAAMEGGSVAFAAFDTRVPLEQRQANMDEFKAGYVGAMAPVLEAEGSVRVEIPGGTAEPETPVWAYVNRPDDAGEGKLPCILYITGGSLITCCFMPIKNMANYLGAVVVEAGWRGFYDGGGYPGTINDLQAVYEWIENNADELGIDPTKIMLFGQSSGGHLALAFSHRLKALGKRPRGCIADYPIPDERTSFLNSGRDMSWGSKDIHASGQAWLGYEHSYPAAVPAEAFANHATPEECVGLCPTFIHTGENETSVDADMAYVSKLIRAGVYCGLNIWPGAAHATLDFGCAAPDDPTPYRQLFYKTLKKQVEDIFQYDLYRGWIDEELAK